jgi:hypothetical protein
LHQAIEDNVHLEEAVRAKQEQLIDVNVELDEYRRRRREEQSLDRADDFFFSNKAILRAAYYRFRTGVQSRFRLSRIHSSISNAYAALLTKLCWNNWRHYMSRRYVMHANVARRRKETLAMCVQQWKVFAALEKYFTQAHRTLLLRHTFTGWRQYAQELSFDRDAANKIAGLHVLQFKRKIFRAWKKTTLFMDWNNPVVRLWEQGACAHFMRTIFGAWRKVAQVNLAQLKVTASKVPHVVLWWHWSRWRALCNLLWRR